MYNFLFLLLATTVAWEYIEGNPSEGHARASSVRDQFPFLGPTCTLDGVLVLPDVNELTATACFNNLLIWMQDILNSYTVCTVSVFINYDIEWEVVWWCVRLL